MEKRTEFDNIEKEYKHENLDLADPEKRVLKSIAERTRISINPIQIFRARRTMGDAAADKVARFGGSWLFIFLFASVLVTWIVINSYVLGVKADAFDPYPYILLNLVLSMMAAVQAPIIMMSQNRQAARDRLDVQSNYQVNLKAELEIMRLHEKLDNLTGQIAERASVNNGRS